MQYLDLLTESKMINIKFLKVSYEKNDYRR
ncbi:MAG: hypothetical protein BAJALOKI2v1_470021 [Promethearchaeota archaeon]|nr:MAG: hypothetical protein BAJALOKI2v1_470021 [Candidatus Lokiarchaeota archaeon]